MPLTDKISFNEKNNEANVVEYCVYSKDPSEITTKLLNSVLIYVNYECKVSDYIWQGESFNLAKRNKKDSKVLPHLYGKSYFGDNIEDEWFIVHILYEISKKFEDLFVQVYDEDGEFLLIEAADTLPKWLDPDNADNRVFIHHGDLHIIPNNLIPTSKSLEVFESLNILNNVVSESLAETKIRNCIKHRIRGFPERIKQNQHTATCFIPNNLSDILTHHPSLISPIVRSFYEHEAEDLKFCSTFKFFKPTTRVNTKVKMTRCLYAQITHKPFTPHHTSGFLLDKKFIQEKSYDLGLKLSYGAEILCRKSEQTKNKMAANKMAANSFNEDNKDWKSFSELLKKSGFFGSELEGSKKYKEQLEQAKIFFISSFLPNIQPPNNSKPNEIIENGNYNVFNAEDAGCLLLYLLAKTDEVSGKNENEDGNRSEKKDGVETRDDDVSDDDSWINICPEELDSILKNFGGENKTCKVDEHKSNNDDLDFNLGEVNEKVKSFVGQESGHLGVEVTKEAQEFDSGDDDEEDEEDDDDESDGDINFDANSFLKAMESILTVTKFDNDDKEDDYEFDYDREQDREGDNDTDDDDESLKHLNPSITDYISLMDKELSKTSIGKSFVDDKEDKSVNKNATTKRTKSPLNIVYAEDDEDDDKEDIKVKAGNDTSKDKSKIDKENKSDDDDNNDDEDEDDKEVDVDYNLMKNLLDSFSSQNGLAGPSTTVLKSLGLYLPPKK